MDSVFCLDYEAREQSFERLSKKGLTSQWGIEDLPWDLDVDPEREARVRLSTKRRRRSSVGAHDDVTRHWTDVDWLSYSMESHRWSLSQFLHGEQAAFLCAGKLVMTLPAIDAKHFAAVQVVDEARHVKVFGRYLDTKLGGHYDVNPDFQLLLDEITTERDWDVTLLGMQILVEGLALASFGMLAASTREPLLVRLLRTIMADEARHVAFGLVSLGQVYTGLTSQELRHRQEFVLDATIRMRDRLAHQEVWERVGVPAEQALAISASSPERRAYEAMLYSRIVPSCRKLGLLDACDGWLRDRFSDLGALAYDRASDHGETWLDEDLERP